MIKKVKQFFNLNRAYQFDITDITAAIYIVCAVLAMCGLNATPLFFIGSAISTAFCWQAHRLNLVALNVALFAMNCYYIIEMIWG